jgi:hypothetical protein
MTLIILNESRTCFMILGSFQIALFLICHRRPLARTHATDSPLDPSELMPIEHSFLPARVLPNSWTLVVLCLARWCLTRDRQKRVAGRGDKNVARRILERPEPSNSCVIS